MRQRWLAAGVSFVGSLIAACGGTSAPPRVEADLVVRHARIYTVDAARSWAEALAVRGDRLLFVGADPGVDAYVGPRTRVVDAGGRLVLPAFHDSHVHPISAGMEARQCDLNEAATRDEVLARVRSCAAADPARPWIVGGGWALPVFPDANPSKALLDAIEPSRPVYLTAADGHSAWVNSRALALAGITAGTPDPPRGRIERDPVTGEPSGTLRESAVDLVAQHLPPPGPSDYRDGLEYALKRFAELGIVAVQEADASREMLDAYLAADRERRLTVRVRASQHVDPEKDVEQIAALVTAREQYRGARLDAGTAKFFLDGVIEAKTAALLEPYLGSTGTGDRGLPNFDQDRLDRLVAGLDRVGFQVHMHAIGDRAIRMGLDAIERAREANGPRDRRPHLAHIQLFDPADIPRFAQLGAIANFQPLWAYADAYIRDLTEPVLGPARSRWLYPIRSLMASGAVVVAGSDWSVSSPDPLQAIEVAMTRREPGAPAGPAWIPEETVDLPQILAAYTIGGAYVSFEERDSGSLEAGKFADFVMLDKDIFELPPNRIHTARVVWTVMEGREVYRREPADRAPGT
jgi:predicted amidohydrolase YtcJ